MLAMVWIIHNIKYVFNYTTSLLVIWQSSYQSWFLPEKRIFIFHWFFWTTFCFTALQIIPNGSWILHICFKVVNSVPKRTTLHLFLKCCPTSIPFFFTFTCYHIKAVDKCRRFWFPDQSRKRVLFVYVSVPLIHKNVKRLGKKAKSIATRISSGRDCKTSNLNITQTFGCINYMYLY